VCECMVYYIILEEKWDCSSCIFGVDVDVDVCVCFFCCDSYTYMYNGSELVVRNIMFFSRVE